MLYLLAIVFPPLAVLFVGKPVQALLNVFLTLLVWIPGVIHALMVVSSHKADQRHKEMLAVMRETSGVPEPPPPPRKPLASDYLGREAEAQKHPASD